MNFDEGGPVNTLAKLWLWKLEIEVIGTSTRRCRGGASDHRVLLRQQHHYYHRPADFRGHLHAKGRQTRQQPAIDVAAARLRDNTDRIQGTGKYATLPPGGNSPSSTWENDSGRRLAVKLVVACAFGVVCLGGYAVVTTPPTTNAIVNPAASQPVAEAPAADADNRWYYVSNISHQCEVDDDGGPAAAIKDFQFLGTAYTVVDTTDPDTGMIVQTAIHHIDGRIKVGCKSTYRGPARCQKVVDDLRDEITRHQ